MVKGLMAILYHYSSTEEDGPQKQYCSESETSWSKFQADKYNGRHTYRPVKDSRSREGGFSACTWKIRESEISRIF